MGSIVGCFRFTDLPAEMEQLPESRSYFRCCTDNYTYMYTALFKRENDLPDSYGGDTYPFEDDSLYDTFPPLPRPLQYDHLQISPSQCPTDGMMKGLDEAHKSLLQHGNTITLESNRHGPDTFSVDPSRQITNASPYMYATLHDEDECLICLEDYDTENPKIVLECTHYYHLSCICEWLQRNQSCPLCGSEMVPLDKKTIYFPHTVQRSE